MLLRKSVAFNLYTQTKSQCRSKYEWITPIGHDTGIKVYHEIAKRQVPLIFPNPKYVKWYMCGPTVYDTAHIGHASCYIRSDIIRRILREYYNIDPVVAIGVTDVSTKIIERSVAVNESPRALARKFEHEFFTQMKELNVLPPSLILRVTEHLPIIANFVKTLVDKGAAYKTVDGSIYFKTTAHKNYGRFKKPVAEDNQEIVPGKLSPLDFAVWKSDPKRKSMPGWHIQCSGMASHIFGSSLDIHSGGMDLIFPHHENEESQSTSYHGCEQWVNYWIHTGLINMGDEKMSKSLKNFYSIREFLGKYSGDNLRMFCMMSPYRNNSNYEMEAINLSVNLCEKVIRFMNMADCYVKGTWLLGNINEAELLQDLANADEIIKNNLSNDFGVHQALKCILLLTKKATKMLNEEAKETTGRSPAVISSVKLYVTKFFRSFGFSFAENESKVETPSALEAIIDTAVNFRMKVREKAFFFGEKNKRDVMNLCDEIRDNLNSIGILINDLSPSHTFWSLKSNNCDGSALKNIIDILVWFRAELQKLIPTLLSDHCQREMLELCRRTKMHLSTLGVIIQDLEDGRSYWSFPKADSEATSKYEIIIDSTLKFYSDIRKIALSLTDEHVEKSKENILALCEDATSTLQSFGIIVNDINESNPQWLLEVNNNKGVSIVQNVMDMIMCYRDQLKSLAPSAKDAATVQKLDNICFKTKKFLTHYGSNISDPFDRNDPTTWNVPENGKNKVFVKNLIDIAVFTMTEIKRTAESLQDEGMKELLLEVYNSFEADLKQIGVVLVIKGEKTTWSFRECESVAKM